MLFGPQYETNLTPSNSFSGRVMATSNLLDLTEIKSLHKFKNGSVVSGKIPLLFLSLQCQFEPQLDGDWIVNDINVIGMKKCFLSFSSIFDTDHLAPVG